MVPDTYFPLIAKSLKENVISFVGLLVAAEVAIGLLRETSNAY